MNKNHITDLHIENFKSIKSMDLKCKRINVFVGKPNVGKSNILEALTLISNLSLNKLNESLIRFGQVYELFYDNDLNELIKISSNLYSSIIKKQDFSNSASWWQIKNHETYTKFNEAIENNSINSFDSNQYFTKNNLLAQISLNYDGSLNNLNFPILQGSPIKRYIFNEKLIKFTAQDAAYLNVPDGSNLLNILTTNKSLRQDVAGFFDEYGLEFLIDRKENIFEVQKRVDGISYKYDYALTADTLRRIIFHLAAIKSNKDSVLIFEEPEAHCFPSYIARMADEIIDADTNQFFIATHSPYLLNRLVEKTQYEDCAIFVTSYKDYQTNVRELTRDEISEMLDFGTDVFINYSAFVD